MRTYATYSKNLSVTIDVNGVKKNIVFNRGIRQEGLMATMIKDPEEAINNNIDIILNGSTSGIKKYFNKYASYKLTDNEINFALKLLEMQKYSMQMFCSWSCII